MAVRLGRADRDQYSEAIRVHSGGGDDDNGSGTATGTPDATDGTTPAKKNGCYTDAPRNDVRIMRTAAIRRVPTRDPAVPPT